MYYNIPADPHLEEMKTFLLRISQEKVTNKVLDDCKVMEYAEIEVDRDKDQYESFLASDTDENIRTEQTEDIPLPDNVEHVVTYTLVILYTNYNREH